MSLCGRPWQAQQHHDAVALAIYTLWCRWLMVSVLQVHQLWPAAEQC